MTGSAVPVSKEIPPTPTPGKIQEGFDTAADARRAMQALIDHMRSMEWMLMHSSFVESLAMRDDVIKARVAIEHRSDEKDLRLRVIDHAYSTAARVVRPDLFGQGHEVDDDGAIERGYLTLALLRANRRVSVDTFRGAVTACMRELTGLRATGKRRGKQSEGRPSLHGADMWTMIGNLCDEMGCDPIAPGSLQTMWKRSNYAKRYARIRKDRQALAGDR